MNKYVFTSGHKDALSADVGDRRFFVIEPDARQIESIMLRLIVPIPDPKWKVANFENFAKVYTQHEMFAYGRLSARTALAALLTSIEADQLARFLSLLAHACSENNIPASTYETLHESIVKLSK